MGEVNTFAAKSKNPVYYVDVRAKCNVARTNAEENAKKESIGVLPNATQGMYMNLVTFDLTDAS